MNLVLRSDALRTLAQVVIGSVWVFHGIYSKVCNGIPRHRLIVGKILGDANAGVATKVIGLLEFLIGLWAFTGWQPVGCAIVQTVTIVAMNSLEILLARELLISGIGMVILNLGFLSLVWSWAIFARTA
jgi:hypothetical protein